MTAPEPREVLKPHEVAAMFRVDPSTVARWRKEGRLKPSFCTPGGESRYYRDEIEALISGTAS